MQEAEGIKSFRLARPDGSAFEPYSPGAHIDVVGPTDVLNQYSLCGPPDQLETYLIAVKREHGPRGGSAALHDKVDIGTNLRISAPRSLLELADDVDKHILVAAGIGLTPMLSLAYASHARRQPFELHYFVRSRRAAAFVDLLEKSDFGDRVQLHAGLTRDEQYSVLREALTTVAPATHVYICGPAGFMERVRQLAEPSVGDAHVHVEHFAAGTRNEERQDKSFEIELDTGEVFEVPPGKSIAEVLEENGLDIDTSCREGICGTCVLDVLSGIPDHRDQCLTKREKQAADRIAACVSRANSPRLVIELP
ncbi:PDR/VanB family oxidoreductase [Nocardia sp. NPDC050793]|uniref:PDR/VanB family oxidoreductase n=1 Tax=Nocardia sp. NPDC050793 TaxID=3155159 RepID=UPI0033CB1D3A